LSETVEFDYVIVGAGSAGCVLANRLSADGKNSVLLLEAGPKDSNLWIDVAARYGKLFKDNSVNWMYQTNRSRDWAGRQVFQPRGKVLGGSSSIKRPAYVAASTRITIAGASTATPAGAMKTCCRMFKKAENQQRGADKYHGAGGPLPVSTGGTLIRCRKPLSPPQRRPASPQIPTSTARRRKARACSRPRRGAADGRVRRFPIFDRPKGAAICMSRPTRWRGASCSKVVAPGRSSTGRAAAANRACKERDSGLRRCV